MAPRPHMAIQSVAAVISKCAGTVYKEEIMTLKRHQQRQASYAADLPCIQKVDDRYTTPLSYQLIPLDKLRLNPAYICCAPLESTTSSSSSSLSPYHYPSASTANPQTYAWRNLQHQYLPRHPGAAVQVDMCVHGSSWWFADV